MPLSNHCLPAGREKDDIAEPEDRLRSRFLKLRFRVIGQTTGSLVSFLPSLDQGRFFCGQRSGKGEK